MPGIQSLNSIYLINLILLELFKSLKYCVSDIIVTSSIGEDGLMVYVNKIIHGFFGREKLLVYISKDLLTT